MWRGSTRTRLVVAASVVTMWGGLASGPWPAAHAQDSAPRCFEQDYGASLTSREPHLEWSQDKTGAQLVENLDYKLDLLEQCLSPAELAGAFGAMSSYIPQRVQDAACFGGDAGVLNPSFQAHRDWAAQRPTQEFMANLRWKIEAAMQCLDATQQRELFADLSFAIALAPLEMH